MASFTPASILSDAILIADVLGLNTNADVVGVFDASTFQQLFVNARPMKATIRETSKVMEHPAETGVILSDHHIINQVEIDLAVMISQEFYSSAYQQLRAAFFASTLLSVQTRAAVYPNMIIADLPHEETADIYDAITVGVHLKQVLFVPAPQTYAPVNPLNNSTVQNGLQSPVAIATQALAGASALASYASLRNFF